MGKTDGKVVSFSKDKQRAEVVKVLPRYKREGYTSLTRHTELESDGLYHWRLKNDKGIVVQHEAYQL